MQGHALLLTFLVKVLQGASGAYSGRSGKGPEQAEELLESAKTFRTRQPFRQPVCLRFDPFDLSILKRIARRKGIPFTQLMSMWVHEKIEQEKATAGI